MSEEAIELVTEGENIGNYTVGAQLGKGAVGTVFRAKALRGDQQVALKVMPPVTEKSGEEVRMTLRAANVLQVMKHPYICNTFESGYLIDGRSYVAMELLDGVSLKEILKGNQVLDSEKAILFCSQLLSALGAIHKAGLVHRDIKPSNLYVIRDKGGVESIKVIDFGLAAVVGARESGSEGKRQKVIYGTATYVSPEQIRGKDFDGRADLYAVGVLLYRMLTGQVPFRSENPLELYKAHLSMAPTKPREIVPSLSPFLEAVVLKALNKNPEARFQSAEEFSEALVAVQRADREHTENGSVRQSSQAVAMTVPKQPRLWPMALVAGLVGGAVFGAFARTPAETSAPLPSETYTISLTSTPAATIYRGGTGIGKTPQSLVFRDKEWLRLEAEGYGSVAIEVGSEPNLSFSLPKREITVAATPTSTSASQPTSTSAMPSTTTNTTPSTLP